MRLFLARALALFQADRLYTQRFKLYGPTASGVHWRSETEQRKRFQILTSMIAEPAGNSALTVADLGCGYGALYPYLQSRGFLGSYTGYERSPHMLAAARRSYPYRNASFIKSSSIKLPAQYTYISGTLNLKMSARNELWWLWVEELLQQAWERTEVALGFNFLEPSRSKTPLDRLFYCPREQMLDFCHTLTPHIELITDPNLMDTHMLLYRHSNKPFGIGFDPSAH